MIEANGSEGLGAEHPQRRMRIVFAGRSTAHFIYYETILESLVGLGAKVQLIYDKGWSDDRDAAVRRFLHEHGDRLTVGWARRRKDRWRRWIFAARELRSYRSYLTRQETTEFYVRRWQGYLTPKLRRLTGQKWFRRLLKSHLVGWVLAKFEALVPPDPNILAELSAKPVDFLFAAPANMRFSEEIEYIKAANRLGIPTAMLVQTWDNLTTKGLVQVVPDQVFVWNESQQQDARDIHGIEERRLRIAGAPFFDRWFEPEADQLDRQTFCTDRGLDAERPFIVYLGSSRNIAVDETWLVRDLVAFLRDHPDERLRDVQVLVRPHPSNTKPFQPLPNEKILVEDGFLPETTDQMILTRSIFQHALATIGINTSAMIEAVILDCPCLSLLTPRYSATQERTMHFRRLVDYDALYLGNSLDEAGYTLSQLLHGNDKKRANRRSFVEAQIRPCGYERDAGTTIAEAVVDVARKRRDASVAAKATAAHQSAKPLSTDSGDIRKAERQAASRQLPEGDA